MNEPPPKANHLTRRVLFWAVAAGFCLSVVVAVSMAVPFFLVNHKKIRDLEKEVVNVNDSWKKEMTEMKKFDYFEGQVLNLWPKLHLQTPELDFLPFPPSSFQINTRVSKSNHIKIALDDIVQPCHYLGVVQVLHGVEYIAIPNYLITPC